MCLRANYESHLFSTDVIRTLGELGVGYLIPCVNTPNVVDAITEFSKGERPQISGFRIVLARTIRSFWRKMLLSTDHHVTLFSTSFNFSGLHAGTGDCRTLLECRVAYFYRQV